MRQANSFARDGLFKEAIESYKLALPVKADANVANRNMGMVYVKLGDFKSAAKHIEKVIARYENDFDSNFYLAEAYRGMDKYAEAIFRYQKSLKIQENEPKAIKALAWSYFKIRYYGEALSFAKKLKALTPADEQATIILARTLLKLKKTDEALATIRSNRDRADEESAAFLASVEGDVLFDRGDFNEAARLYRQALGTKPLLAGALLGLGRCLLEEKNFAQAVIYIERSIRLRPQFTEAHYFLGRAYEATDLVKAVKSYRVFAKLAATDPEFVAQVSEVNKRMASKDLKLPGGTGNNAKPDLLAE